MRLDKFIAQCTPLSRKQVKFALRDKRISINGECCRSASQHINPELDKVCCDGELLETPQALYLMMNKPEDCVCATQDSSQATVIDLLFNSKLNIQDLSIYNRIDDIQIVGRLDKDTTGLLLLTTNGQWNHELSSPKRLCSKTYVAELAEALPEGISEQFTQGILLKSESKPTLPAELRQFSETRAEVKIYEGRYHQVKRMFAACGNRVTKLKRTAISGLKLDDALAPGEFRALSQEELNLLEKN